MLKTHNGTQVEVGGTIWKWQTHRAVQAAKLFESTGNQSHTVEGFDPSSQQLVTEVYQCRAAHGIIHVRLLEP